MAERLLTLFFLVISIMYAHYAGRLSFGSLAAPKAGFVPMIAGSIAVLLALFLVAKLLLQKHMREAVNINWRKLIFIIIGLLVYILLIKLAGYMMATFIIMLYLFKVTETTRWVMPCLLSTGFAISFYYVFKILLGINLP